MSITIKINKMKKIILLGILIITNISCKSQVLPLEKLIDYVKVDQGAPDGTMYIKDVNNIRQNYLGVWKGSYNNKNYEIYFTNYTNHFIIDEDQLLMRYLITDSNGKILEDTRSLPNDSPFIATSRYYEKSFFVLTYQGRQSDCGQAGELFVEAQKSTNYKTLKLFLSPRQGFINSQTCPNGAAVQLFPKDNITLTKQ